jgi:hypothetical protein
VCECVCVCVHIDSLQRQNGAAGACSLDGVNTCAELLLSISFSMNASWHPGHTGGQEAHFNASRALSATE